MKVDGRIQMFPLLRAALAFTAGIVIGDSLHDAVAAWMWMCAMSVATATAAALFAKGRSPIVQTAALLAAIMLCGAWRTAARAEKFRLALDGSEETYGAVVASAPSVRGKTLRYEIIATDRRLAGRRLLAYFAQPMPPLAVGDGLEVTSRIENAFSSGGTSGTAKGATAADGRFDYNRWLLTRGIAARTYVARGHWHGKAQKLAQLSGAQRLLLFFGRMRSRMMHRLESSGMRHDAQAIVAAMTLGDRSLLTQDLRDTYSASGASHVLALSGLHLGIIYFLLSLLLAHGSRHSAMQGLIIAAVWSYAAMAGMPPSIVRSAIMYTVFSLTSMAGRHSISLNTLSLAALLILACSPESLWDVGFQMSFLAVLGIITLNGGLARLVPARRLSACKPARWLWSLTTVSLSAQIAVAPTAAYYFGRFPCYFLLSNLIAIPLATLLIYTSMAMYAAFFSAWLQGLLATAAAREAAVLNESLAWVASLPGASIGGISLNGMQLAAIYALTALAATLARYLTKMRKAAYGRSELQSGAAGKQEPKG